MRGTGERIDLRSGIVDVIFPRHRIARRFQQAGQRIPDDRAPAMPHVHRPGRVGRHIFNIDPLPGAECRPAITVATLQDGPQFVTPQPIVEPHVDEARPGNLSTGDAGKFGERRGDQRGKRARVGPGSLGQHHRRIGRQIAVRRIARRLNGNGTKLQPVRQIATRHEIVEHAAQLR